MIEGTRTIEIRGRDLTYTDEEFETFEKVGQMYRDENKRPVELTPGQCQIFNLIAKRKYSHSHLMAHTRYGKSLTVALAVLTRVSNFAEKWCIVAPSKEKARIIMSYIIQHAGDDPFIKAKLDIEKGESYESLRRYRTKDRLNFRHSDGTLGEVFIIGVDAANSQKAGDAAMGFGSPNLIMDEAALIGDDIEAKIFRMLGDNTDDYFYLKIGNPFTRGHFLKDARDDSIFHLNFDDKFGLKEGRVNEEFLAKAKAKPFYSILYENKFPAADMVDKDGWSPLVTDEDIEEAMVDEDIPMFGEQRIGLDVARGGGCFNVWTQRAENFAKILRKDEEDNLMITVGSTEHILTTLGIPYNQLFIDDIGVGGGVTDRFREQRKKVNPVNVANSAVEDMMYVNLRAEAYWRLRLWIKAGGKLKRHSDWWQITNIKYKAKDSSGKLMIMSKEQMAKRGIESPDSAESLMLTFAAPTTLKIKKALKNKIKRVSSGNSGRIKVRMSGY